MPAGYSGTPLARKLGYTSGQSGWFHAMPDSVSAEIGDTELELGDIPGEQLDAAHVFVTARADLERLLVELRASIAPDGMVWVSWPKKASKVPTEVTEDTIREVALPMGWVDVKVCAIDATWSALKLVIRKALR